MRLLLDILTGAGLAGAVGLRPFLPVLAAGAFARYDLGIDFDGTAVAFLESPWLLLAVLALMGASVAVQRRIGAQALEQGPLGQALGGIAIGFGALLFAGALDDRHDIWWPGLLAGAACAALTQAAVRGLFARVRKRLDRQASDALVVYGDGASLVAAVGAVLLPPLSVGVLGLAAFLLGGGRRREGEKFAGLRILR